MRMVGWKADPALIKQFNPKMIFWGIAGGEPHSSDHLVTLCNSSFEQVKVMEKMEFICSFHSIMTPTARYSDIILPARIRCGKTKGSTKCRLRSLGCSELLSPR